MDELLERLGRVTLQESEKQAGQRTGEAEICLDTMLKTLSSDWTEKEELNALSSLTPFLSPSHPLADKAAQVVAEVAKKEVHRSVCISLLSSLLSLLDSEQPKVLLHTGRALGNICYDNPPAQEVVSQTDAPILALGLLKSNHTPRVCAVLAGFIGNCCRGDEPLQRRLVQAGLLGNLSTLLERVRCHGNLTDMVLVALGNVASLDLSREEILKTPLCSQLVALLRDSVERKQTVDCQGTPEHETESQGESERERRETILDVIAAMAEHDEVKERLVSAGLPQLLLRAVKECQKGSQGEHPGSEERLAELKAASDLLVLLLLGEVAMQNVFGEGEDSVLSATLHWLDSPTPHLQLAGALAIANFARSDDNCIRLVKGEAVPRLLELLRRQAPPSTEDGGNGSQVPYDETLQHAALSALRNLAIPAVNKPRLVEFGVLDTVLAFLPTNSSPVQFRLIGTLRMLTEGQSSVALCLGQRSDVAHRLVEWSEGRSQSTGVVAEASRLLSALPRHSRDKEVCRVSVEVGAVVPLVAMINSQFPLMQCEALLALTIISQFCLEKAVPYFHDSGLIEVLTTLFRSAASATSSPPPSPSPTHPEVPPEVIANGLALLASVLHSDKLRENAKSAALPLLVSNLSTHSSPVISKPAASLLASLK
uniref:Si:dkey-191g9.5 n=1 Tax=Eptatretus burgeri TaxID=7764 RepID=A0A8C4X1J8_EPTBU